MRKNNPKKFFGIKDRLVTLSITADERKFTATPMGASLPCEVRLFINGVVQDAKQTQNLSREMLNELMLMLYNAHSLVHQQMMMVDSEFAKSSKAMDDKFAKMDE